MYAATITKPCGGQTCNIFWPFEEDHVDLDEETTIRPLAETESKMNDSKLQTLNGQTAFTFYSFFLGFAFPLFLILVFYVQVKLSLLYF